MYWGLISFAVECTLLVLRLTGKNGHNLLIIKGWTDFPPDWKLFNCELFKMVQGEFRPIFPSPQQLCHYCTKINAMSVLESIQDVFGWRWGYIPDMSAIQCNWTEDRHSHSHQQVILLPDCLAWTGFLWGQISNILSVFQSHSHHSGPCIMESQKTHCLKVIKQDQQGFFYLISSLVFILTSLQMNKQCKLFWA